MTTRSGLENQILEALTSQCKFGTVAVLYRWLWLIESNRLRRVDRGKVAVEPEPAELEEAVSARVGARERFVFSWVSATIDTWGKLREHLLAVGQKEQGALLLGLRFPEEDGPYSKKSKKPNLGCRLIESALREVIGEEQWNGSMSQADSRLELFVVISALTAAAYMCLMSNKREGDIGEAPPHVFTLLFGSISLVAMANVAVGSDTLPTLQHCIDAPALQFEHDLGRILGGALNVYLLRYADPDVLRLYDDYPGSHVAFVFHRLWDNPYHLSAIRLEWSSRKDATREDIIEYFRG